jgi:UDP-2,3-diacylglucosamine pyrophosphatase LpxH
VEKVEALLISDVHLGSKGSNSEKLLKVLKSYTPEKLIIVGDFIDGWLLEKRFHWRQSYTNVIRKVLSYSKKGTEVIYITGNHDDFLRNYTPIFFDKNIKIVDDYILDAKLGKYWITHGDKYDGITELNYLAKIGSYGYEVAIRLDKFFKKIGINSRISKWLKENLKNAIKFISDFEFRMASIAKNRKLDGVICGHIHTPCEKTINGVHYINTGDWIENNSFVIIKEKIKIKYKK